MTVKVVNLVNLEVAVVEQANELSVVVGRDRAVGQKEVSRRLNSKSRPQHGRNVHPLMHESALTSSQKASNSAAQNNASSPPKSDHKKCKNSDLSPGSANLYFFRMKLSLCLVSNG